MIIGRGGKDIQAWEWNQQIFQQLEKNRESIEEELLELGSNEWPIWQPTTESGRIAIYRPGNIYAETESWDEYHDWIIDKFLKFRAAFNPLLEEIVEMEAE